MIDCFDEKLYYQNNTTANNRIKKSQNFQQEPRQQSIYQAHQQKQLQPLVNMTQEFLPTQANINTTSIKHQQALQPIHHPQQQLLLDLAQGVNNVTSNQQQQTGNELIGYYFGSISRETAEWILKTHGNNLDGSYLLRNSGPNDDFVLSLMVVNNNNNNNSLEVLHYKIVETEDSFVALHGQVGDEKFATIDELIEKAQGVATKPTRPINRQSLDSQILPPTYWGLSVDQVRLAILIKAKQWGFPLLSALFQNQNEQQLNNSMNYLDSTVVNINSNVVNTNSNSNNVTTTLNNETIRTLIYKSLHEFQPWFHGKISREEAERRIEDGLPRDGKFLVRERDNFSYAMCICHKKTTKHYRIDVLPTGELAIQDGRKFTSLMALVSHYTIMSDGLWCALTEACPRPIQANSITNNNTFSIPTNKNIQASLTNNNNNNNVLPTELSISQAANNSYNQNLYCIPPKSSTITNQTNFLNNNQLPIVNSNINDFLPLNHEMISNKNQQENNGSFNNNRCQTSTSLICANQGGVNSIKVPIKEWLQNINQKWTQLIGAKNQHQSLNSFLFGSQNPLNNHCRHNHNHNGHNQSHSHGHNHHHRKRCKNGHASCACIHMQLNSKRSIVSGKSNHTEYNNNDGINKSSSRLEESKVKCNQEPMLSKVLPASYWNNCSTLKTLPCQSTMVQRNCTTLPYPNGANLMANFDQNVSSKTILSCLPQNSGFALNGNSFIGSPLFAVNKTNIQSDIMNNNNNNNNNSNIVSKTAASLQKNGSCNVGTAAAAADTIIGGEGEGKLISPAQSISANLNNTTININNNNNITSNPYHINNDIYGSQTSTAIIHDRLPTTSSSSSSGCHFSNKKNVFNPCSNTQLINTGFNNNNNNNFNLKQPLAHLQANGMVVKQVPKVQAYNGITNQGGSIMCGQHAGPAYRYTNFQDEHSIKPCYHRTGNRAIDDSQLITPSTELIGPAAMTKFVQFQDGQCLRTHRDTRSIQMAYLSSRQQISQQNHNLSSNNQVPLKELNQQGNSLSNNNTYLNNNNNNNNSNGLDMKAHNLHNSDYKKGGKLFYNQNHRPIVDMNQLINENQCSNYNFEKRNCNEIDLMDCGENNEFEFKYDPKLIKSSSIETLCGVGVDEEENLNDLSNFKTNSELLMSLQSCWRSEQNYNTDILCPTIAGDNYQEQGFNSNCNQEIDTEANYQPAESLLESSLITYDNNNVNETYDHMKKKHDLDEVTTAILAELTASLKAQVDLKNKRAGFGFNSTDNKSKKELSNEKYSSCPNNDNISSHGQQSAKKGVETDPIELINEFDTIIHSTNNR